MRFSLWLIWLPCLLDFPCGIVAARMELYLSILSVSLISRSFFQMPPQANQKLQNHRNFSRTLVSCSLHSMTFIMPSQGCYMMLQSSCTKNYDWLLRLHQPSSMIRAIACCTQKHTHTLRLKSILDTTQAHAHTPTPTLVCPCRTPRRRCCGQSRLKSHYSTSHRYAIELGEQFFLPRAIVLSLPIIPLSLANTCKDLNNNVLLVKWLNEFIDLLNAFHNGVQVPSGCSCCYQQGNPKD